MRDFVNTLEAQLIAAAETHEPRRNRALFAVPVLAVGAIAAVVVAFVLAAGGSGPRTPEALAVPILARPAVHAPHGVDITPLMRKNGVDPAQARAFDTPVGTGYMLPYPDGGGCLFLPDPVDGYGKACSSAAEFNERGLVGMMGPGPGQAGAGYYVAVLPTGASDPVVRRGDGSTARVAQTDGAAVTSLAPGEQVTYTIAGHDYPLAMPQTPPLPTIHNSCVQSHGGAIETSPTRHFSPGCTPVDQLRPQDRPELFRRQAHSARRR